MRLHLGILLALTCSSAVWARTSHNPAVFFSKLSLHPVFSSSALFEESQSTPTSNEIQQHLAKARQHLQEKRPALAIPEFAAIVAIDPNNLDAQANLGVLLYFQGQYADALSHLRKAVQLDPNVSKIQGLLGLCEYQLGEIKSARSDMAAALGKLTDAKFR